MHFLNMNQDLGCPLTCIHLRVTSVNISVCCDLFYFYFRVWWTAMILFCPYGSGWCC